MVELPSLSGVEHLFVDTGQLTVHVATAGPEDGEPIVLLHGWPQHWWCWRHVIPLLADTYRLYMPDLRGHGWSDAPRGGYAKEHLATDLLSTLDALELGHVTLVGHDWGGWTGFLACFREPSRFAHFVSVNMPPPSVSVPPLAVLDLWRATYMTVVGGPFGALLLRNRPDVVARMILAGAVHRDAWTPEDLHLFADVLAEPERARASSLLYRSFLLEDLPGVLAGRYRETQLPVPTTLLYGTKDLVIRPWMLQAGPGWSMEIVTADDSGHFLPEERPDLVASAVRQEF